MKFNRRHLATAALIMGVCVAAHASPFASAAQDAADETTSIVQTGGAILGGVVTFIGGAITAWKATHNEEFTKPLVFTLVGAAIGAVSLIL